MPKPIENGQKPLENVFRTPTDCRFWETTAIATHENKERLMYSKGLLLNQIEQMRSYRTFPLVGPMMASPAAALNVIVSGRLIRAPTSPQLRCDCLSLCPLEQGM